MFSAQQICCGGGGGVSECKLKVCKSYFGVRKGNKHVKDSVPSRGISDLRNNCSFWGKVNKRLITKLILCYTTQTGLVYKNDSSPIKGLSIL